MPRMIKLEIKLSNCQRYEDNVTHHDKSEPFAMSAAGLLVHRVRYRKTFKHDNYSLLGKSSHDAVHYWCGNATCNPLMFYDVPAGRMVCAKCEAAVAARAERNGKKQKTAADLVGHTISLGALVAVKVGTQRVTRGKNA